MKLPNFLIIGAAKCGTTSLWSYLRQHPEVFLPANKEPNYFVFCNETLPKPGPVTPRKLYELIYTYTINEYNEYSCLFRNAVDCKAVGEASVRYLYYYSKAAERIRNALPNVKLLVILRNPVKRLYSHYCMNRQYGLEPYSLMKAVDQEDDRVNRGWDYDWHYRRVGMYSRQLECYFKLFGKERVSILLFEDLVAKPIELFHDVCRFLEIGDGFVPDVSQREKSAYMPRILALDRILNPPGKAAMIRKSRVLSALPIKYRQCVVSKLDEWNRMPVCAMTESEESVLRRLFSDDIEKVQNMIGRQLDW